MAIKGKGAQLLLYNGTALAAVGELLAVTPPAGTRDVIDTTHHGSAGDYREFISSLIDAGEASATIHYVPGSAEDTALNAAFAAGDLRAFKIVLNGATLQRQTTGSALLTRYAPSEVVIDDKMTAGITLKVSGPLVFAALAA